MNRPIMPTIKIPIWIKSEYVTIVSPPFQKDMGAKKRLPESKGANRLPLIDSARKSIP